MKMANDDYNRILVAFQNNAEKVKEYYEFIKSSGKFKVVEERVAWDCLRAFMGTSFALEQYNKGLNDTHIKTACVKALKQIIEVKAN